MHLALGCGTLLVPVAAVGQPNPPTYMTIPLVGEFGDQIQPQGLRNAIALASTRHIHNLVFVLDSPGGEVWAGREIAEILKENDSGFTYYFVVKRALSASMWPLVWADHIYMSPGSATGAAVAYGQNPSTGEVNVDAKFNSAVAAQLASMNEARGRSGAAIRAMVVREAELWVWHDPATGRCLLFDHKPAGAAYSTAFLRDSADTVLTLTAQEAIDYGLADGISDEAGIGSALKIADWISMGKSGQNAMRRASDNIRADKKMAEKRIADVETGFKTASRHLTDAREADPENLDVWYKETSGLLTPETQRRWRDQTDAALRAWQRLSDDLAAVRDRAHDAETTCAELPGPIAELLHSRLEAGWNPDDCAAWMEEAISTMKRLRDERGRYRVDGR
ncbi:MAG: hypothetical protein IT437_11275 [Phycisphaerales bacterium]|nr:hypothetical protein [Phycisphaerales bacterium]